MNKIQKALLIEAQNSIDSNPAYATELLKEVLADDKADLKDEGIGWIDNATRAYK